jgi:hypothetical protein
MLVERAALHGKGGLAVNPSANVIPAALIQVRSDGAPSRIIATSPSKRSAACGDRGDGELATRAAPFCAQPLGAIAEDGSRIAFAIQENATQASSSYHVIALDGRGDTVFARAYPYSTIPVSRHTADSVRANVSPVALKQSPVPSRGAAGNTVVHIPTTYPPLRRIIVGSDRTIWLEMWTAAAVHHWVELDPMGNPDAVVDLPLEVRVEAAAESRIWCIQRDPVRRSTDIIRYRLVR